MPYAQHYLSSFIIPHYAAFYFNVFNIYENIRVSIRV
jgi:hypothetical protein